MNVPTHASKQPMEVPSKEAHTFRGAPSPSAGTPARTEPAFDPEAVLRHVRDFDQTPLAGLVKAAYPAIHDSCVARQASAREYAEEHLWPNVNRWDQMIARDHDFAPWSAIDGALKHRFLSMALPPVFGGLGVDTLAMNVWTEEISAADAGMYVVFGSHSLALSALYSTFDMGLIGRLGREITSGEKEGRAVLLALAYTEVGGGSDVEDVDEIKRGRITSRWTRVAGGYRLNARKVFISGGNLANIVVVSAYGDPKHALDTSGVFLVRKDAPGFSIGRTEHKMGQRLCPAVEVLCDDVFVAQDDAAFAPDGARNIDTTLSFTRGPVGAMATGVIRGAIERTVRYLAQKRHKGHWLFEEQWVTLALADMLAALAAGRGLYMQSALSLNRWGAPSLAPKLVLPKAVQETEFLYNLTTHPNSTKRARDGYAAGVSLPQLQRVVADGSIAKFMCSDLAVNVCMKAMEILGEDANDPEWGVEKCLRDVKLAQIFEGTNEVNRLHVTRGLLPHS